MITKRIYIVILLLPLFVILAYGKTKDDWVIPSIEDQNTYFMQSGVWLKTFELDTTTTQLIQTSYVRGFWDGFLACHYGCSDCSQIRMIISDCAGMDIYQIVDSINKFYKDYPQWRDKWCPTYVMLYVIPRLRKGLSPIDPTIFKKHEKDTKDSLNKN